MGVARKPLEYCLRMGATHWMNPNGCGSKPMVLLWGRCTTHSSFSGDWDVHWGYDLEFDPWPNAGDGPTVSGALFRAGPGDLLFAGAGHLRVAQLGGPDVRDQLVQFLPVSFFLFLGGGGVVGKIAPNVARACVACKKRDLFK